jgi:hypothetical protein
VGERQAGFVSAVEGVERFAASGLAGFAAGGVVTFDEVSDTEGAVLANPAPRSSRAMAAAASMAVFSGSGSVSGVLPVAVLPYVTTGSGADAPSGLAGTSGRPLLCVLGSLGVTTALGTVTSER